MKLFLNNNNYLKQDKVKLIILANNKDKVLINQQIIELYFNKFQKKFRLIIKYQVSLNLN